MIKCEDVKQLQPILEYLVSATRALISYSRALNNKLSYIEDSLQYKETFPGLQKKIIGLEEQLEGFLIHYQSTLKEIKELRKPKTKRYIYNK